MQVKIPLTPKQATELLALTETRKKADREFTLYCQAIVSGTEYTTVGLVGIEAESPQSPPALVVSIPDPEPELPHTTAPASGVDSAEVSGGQ